MLNDARPDQFSKIYIRPGKTDCRMGISGLSNLIRFELRLNPFQKNVLFLFSGNSRKMIKALIWEGDGFLVMTKKASSGHFMWPKNREEVLSLTPEQFGRLMHGFTIDGAIRETNPKYTG